MLLMKTQWNGRAHINSCLKLLSKSVALQVKDVCVWLLCVLVSALQMAPTEKSATESKVPHELSTWQDASIAGCPVV